MTSTRPTDPQQRETTPLAWVALILSILLAPIGLILAFVAIARESRGGRRPSVVSWIALAIGAILSIGVMVMVTIGVIAGLNGEQAPPASDRTIDVTIDAEHAGRDAAEIVAGSLPARAAALGVQSVTRSDVVDDATVRVSFAEPVADGTLGPEVLNTALTVHEVTFSGAYGGGECATDTGVPALHKVVCDADAGELYVLAPAELSGSAIVAVERASADPGVVDVTLDAEGTTALASLTTRLAEQQGRLAIVSGTDVLSAPTVVTPIMDGRVQIASADATGADALSAALRLGMTGATLTPSR